MANGVSGVSVCKRRNSSLQTSSRQTHMKWYFIKPEWSSSASSTSQVPGIWQNGLQVFPERLAADESWDNNSDGVMLQWERSVLGPKIMRLLETMATRKVLKRTPNTAYRNFVGPPMFKSSQVFGSSSLILGSNVSVVGLVCIKYQRS